MFAYIYVCVYVCMYVYLYVYLYVFSTNYYSHIYNVPSHYLGFGYIVIFIWFIAISGLTVYLYRRTYLIKRQQEAAARKDKVNAFFRLVHLPSRRSQLPEHYTISVDNSFIRTKQTFFHTISLYIALSNI